MKRKTFLMLCFLLVIPGLLGTALAGIPQYVIQDDELKEKAARFRRYRVQIRQEGTRERDELHHAKGPMSPLMDELGKRLAKDKFTLKQVRELLGKPDQIHGSGKHHGTITVPAGETHWVYYWRGGHDYMFLIVKQGCVIGHDWWFAFE